MFIYLLAINIAAYHIVKSGEALFGIIFAAVGGSAGAVYALRYTVDDFPLTARRILRVILFIHIFLLALIPE